MILKTYYHPEIQKTFYIDEDLSEDIPVYTISVVFRNALIVIGQYKGSLVDADGVTMSKAELLEAFLDEYYTKEVEDKVEEEIEKRSKKDLDDIVFDIGDC